MGMDQNLERDLVIKSTSHVTLERREYDMMRLASAKLDMLEAHGVDNWIGYCDAMRELHDSEEYGTQPSGAVDTQRDTHMDALLQWASTDKRTTPVPTGERPRGYLRGVVLPNVRR